MGLEVIGAGVGRTGTTSLKVALEQLGLGPCYHMFEVITNPPYAEYWARAAAGEKMDWDEVFRGYRSAVDWPSADYWRELAAWYPAAKVILTVRDPEAWFKSTQATIFSELNRFMRQDNAIGRTMRAIAKRHFQGDRLADREVMLAAFKRHNESVKNSDLGSRLLVYDVSQGWGPLCRFLGKPVPSTPFPTANTTDEFRARASSFPANQPSQ